jgi:FkbM family methyltransferase
LQAAERRDRQGRGKLLAKLRLECSGAATRLARVPLFGGLLQRVGRRMLPQGTLIWTQIQKGVARGLWLLVDARTGAELRRGDREPEVQEALRNHLARKNVFYDVGANAGFFELVASRLLAPAGRIYAFEAGPDVAMRLRGTVERNGLENVTVVEAAVWSESGVVHFDRGLGSPDRMVGHVTEGSGGENGTPVRATSLDDFARQAPPPDVIKCDVEGAELEVFRGARNVLASSRPTVICEVHSAENLEQLRKLFQEAGYRVQLLEAEGNFPIHLLAVEKR